MKKYLEKKKPKIGHIYQFYTKSWWNVLPRKQKKKAKKNAGIECRVISVMKTKPGSTKITLQAYKP